MKKIIIMATFGLFALACTGALGHAADKGLSSKDKSFLKDAASGGLMEVQMGRIAQENGHSEEVKSFGGRMVTDHGKAGDKLKQIAQQKGVKYPTDPTMKQKYMIGKLHKMKQGEDFDKAYIRDMVTDHTKDVATFEKAAREVKDTDLNAWFAETLPVIKEHLKQAKEIAKKLGVAVKE